MDAIGVMAKAYETSTCFALDVGINNFILEGDSLIISNTSCELSPPPSLTGSIVYGILFFSHVFRRVEILHVR